MELAIGDAYGAGFEYADVPFVRAHNDLGGYVRLKDPGTCSPGAHTMGKSCAAHRGVPKG